MPREPQEQKHHGSQKWLQRLVNDYPSIINEPLATALQFTDASSISWLSPMREDEYAEYRDSSFLERLGATLPHEPLQSFWPNRGPQWDGLAVAGKDRSIFILVEAKAHLAEICSAESGAEKPESLRRIRESLARTREFLGSTNFPNWSRTFYQYCNRLAHLYLMRELNKLDAYLLFIYFLNDEEMGGPSTEEEWQHVLRLLRRNLGLGDHPLSDGILNVFIDTRKLEKETA